MVTAIVLLSYVLITGSAVCVMFHPRAAADLLKNIYIFHALDIASCMQFK